MPKSAHLLRLLLCLEYQSVGFLHAVAFLHKLPPLKRLVRLLHIIDGPTLQGRDEASCITHLSKVPMCAVVLCLSDDPQMCCRNSYYRLLVLLDAGCWYTANARPLVQTSHMCMSATRYAQFRSVNFKVSFRQSDIVCSHLHGLTQVMYAII